MKKVISLFLTVVMCLSLGVPAFAADVDTGDSIVVDQDAGIAAQADTGTASDMRLTLPTAITVHDDRMGGYTVGAAEVRNDSEAKATITGVTVTPAQHWSIAGWDDTRANVPVNSKTFSMKVFGTAINTEGKLPDGATLPQVAGGSASDMDVSFWMAPQSDAYGEQQVAAIVVTAEFEELPVYAILYSDGELVFQKGSTPEEGRTVTATYADVETAKYRPWSTKAGNIQTVTFNCDVAPMSADGWFGYMHSLTQINGLNKLNTSNTTTMESMFDGCSELTTLDVSGFDTSNVTTMKNMFSGCIKLTTLDVSGWDTSSVTDMRTMFGWRAYGLDIPSGACSSLTFLDVSGWDTSNVTTMESMFDGCSKLTALDVSNWDTSNVVDMDEMFNSCRELAFLDVSKWNTSNVTSMRNMFCWCTSLTLSGISEWDVHNVTDISGMFTRNYGFTSLDLSSWDVSSVTTMDSTFENCINLTSLDLSSWDTSKTTTMTYMFAFDKDLATIYVSPSFVADGVRSNSMFLSCSKLVGGNGTKYTNSNDDATYARIDIPGTPGYFTAKPGTATVSLDAAALDSMAATPPATDAVTAPAESDNTYEVGDDTDIVEVPETPDVTPEPEPQPSPEPEQEEEPKQEPGSEPEPTPEPTPEPEQETPAANSDPVTKPDEVTPEKPDDGDGEELGTGETEAGDELTPEQTATA